MKEIYTQVFEELPDIGTIEYIGSKSKNSIVDYGLEGVREKSKNKNFDSDNIEKNINKNLKNFTKANVNFSQSYGEDTIRFYANIDDVKTMVNNGMYSELMANLANSKCKIYNDFVNIRGKLKLYDGFIPKEDVFVNVNGYCVWLKAKLLDTDVQILSDILGDVNIIGYVIKQKTTDAPAILKAIAIYT